MKANIYNLLKAKFLVSDDSLKNWLFIVYVIFLVLIMIANNHQYDAKNYRITELSKEVKELRSKFVDTRSELMKLKMESTITRKMESRGIKPSEVPPQKIKVLKTKEESFLSRLWQ
ncbi:MAG TPA: S-adenosyl-methyltransferase [Flavobacterium sp.]|nr:S-adenosyl-methyltransferase [Flavobacterium sp.]